MQMSDLRCTYSADVDASPKSNSQGGSRSLDAFIICLYNTRSHVKDQTKL